MSDGSLHDLTRALEQDKKREQDHKHKWALGEGVARDGSPSGRPEKPASHKQTGYIRREVQYQSDKAAKITKIARKHEEKLDRDLVNSDSSADEDVAEASAAPVPDAGYTYSFDAPRGPGQGSQILGMALAMAEEKFENKATNKLIKDEYEVVGKEKEDPDNAVDEDGFELL